MSGQLRLLPSELARLVLGYLMQHDCHDAAESFLKELPELGECLSLRKHGRPVCTTVGDRSLEDMLNDYSDAREQVQNNIQQHPGVLRNISKSWDLNQQLMEITKIATEKRPMQEVGTLGRKSSSIQMVRTRLLNKQLRNSVMPTQQCCEHCTLKNQQTNNPLLDVSTTSIKDLPGSVNHLSSNPAEDDQIILRDSTESDSQDSTISQKISGSEDDTINKASMVQLMRMKNGLQSDVNSQSNIENSSACQEFSNSNISSSSIDATPQKRKGNQVKRRSQGQIGPNNISATVDEDVHFEIMLKKLMEDTTLHEKIAENINRGLSCSQSRGQQQSSSQDGSCSLETFKTDGSKIEKSGDDSTFPRELESIITNIVSETTESPNFETILEEVFGSSLQKSVQMNSEGIQNELFGIPTRPLSTPIPQSQSADNITNHRTSTVYKENNQNVNSSSTKESSFLYKISQKDKMWDSKLRESSHIKNYQFGNQIQSETSKIDHKNDVINDLTMKKAKIANTDGISSSNMSSTSENSPFLRSEMNVPHKLRHKLNRSSSSIQLNSNSTVTSQTDNLLTVSSQPFEKNEERVHENVNNYVSENKSANNNLDKDMEHVKDTDIIKHVEIQTKEIGTLKKSIKKQNSVDQMSHKIDCSEIKNTYNQVDEIDNESDSSRESLHIECSLPSLDKTYRISDISNIPNTSNKNISKISSEIMEQDKNTSESLLQITSPTPQKSILIAPDSNNVNENTNQEINSTNNIEISTNPPADLISRNATPIKSMTVPGIATTLPVKQMESPYKIVERNDSTLTELKTLRSDISSSAVSAHWSPSLNMKENPSKSTNLNLSDVSMTSSNITNDSENTLNVNSSTSTNHIANNFSLELPPICISQPVKEMDHGFQPINCLSNTSGVTSLAQVQVIQLPMNMGGTNSKERYCRAAPRAIAPRPIAPKLDSNLSYIQKKNNYETTYQDNIRDDHLTLDTPVIKLPIDTVVYPAIESINPAPVTTYKLANNVTFTIPSISSVMPIPNQNAKVVCSEENKRNSPSKKKSPKSPIRGRVVNMTRVKNKNGVGKAGKRKLRAQKELENVSKSNDLVNAAVTLSLSTTPTKKQSPLKGLESPSDSKINDSSNRLLQKDANTSLSEKESQRNSEENSFLLSSVSPKLKELLQMSKNIGSGKKKTKCYSVHKSPVCKVTKELPSRGSQSTPSHKNSHVRVLDFGTPTPRKDISPRKLRKQQVMQSLNFSPRLRFKKTLKNSTLDDSPSKPCNKFSPKKRILERIQEETSNTLEKDNFMSNKRMKKHAMSKKKPQRHKNKSSVSEPSVNTIVSSKDPHADDNNSNKKFSSNSKSNNIHNDKNEKDCIQIVNNQLPYESVSNSVNEKLCDSSNKNLILETPLKTNDILTLELATPFLKSVRNTCNNEGDLNTPFPKFSEDHEQNRSPKIDKNHMSTSSVLSTHYLPGINDQNGVEFPKPVAEPANTKNHEKDHKKYKKDDKKNFKTKKKINEKKISEIKMGKKIEEEIASRFGSPNNMELQMEMSMNLSNLCKQSSPQCHDVNQAMKKVENSSSKCNDSKFVPIEQKLTSSKDSIIIEKGEIKLQKGKKTLKRITRSTKKLENSLCIPEKKFSRNLSPSEKITDYNENMNKSKEYKGNTEKESLKLIEKHCDNMDLLATELQNKNYVGENFVTKEANGSDESSGESSKWQIDDESPELKSRTPVENIEDQVHECLPCTNINSESDENNEYEEETFQDLNLTYSEYIDIFSLNLAIRETSQKRLNKRLWVEGSSKWSPKRKRPRRRINHGTPRTPNEEEFPSIDEQSELQKNNEILNEEEKQMEMRETMEQLVTPVRGSVSERSVGSSVSSSSPGRLVISQSPFWVVDDNVMTPNQSLVAENKEDTPQNSKCASIEGIENLDSSSHGVTACLKCNKEIQNSSINLEKRDIYKKGCHCVCESSNENQKTFIVDGNYSSETSKQNQQRSKKAKLINKVLFHGGTLEIAQNPTKQMAIVTEPQIPDIQVPSIDGISEESNVSIIPPTPGKNLLLEKHGISSSNSCKSESNLQSLGQLPKASNTREKIINTKKDCEYDENTNSDVNIITETEMVNQSPDDNSTFCTVNLPKQLPSSCDPQNKSNNYQASHSDESDASVTSSTPVNSSAEKCSTNDVSEGGILTNLKITKPKKNLKLVQKMNIEEFLKNIHK